MPILCCLNRTGPFEVSLTQFDVSKYTGDKTMIASDEIIMSIPLFIYCCHMGIILCETFTRGKNEPRSFKTGGLRNLSSEGISSTASFGGSRSVNIFIINVKQFTC